MRAFPPLASRPLASRPLASRPLASRPLVSRPLVSFICGPSRASRRSGAALQGPALSMAQQCPSY